MLTGFGIFWGSEGAGAHWPGADAALPAIVPAVALFALALAALLRRSTARPHEAAAVTGDKERQP